MQRKARFHIRVVELLSSCVLLQEVSEELLAGSRSNGALLAEIETLERQLRNVRTKRLALECPPPQSNSKPLDAVTAKVDSGSEELSTTTTTTSPETNRQPHLKARVARSGNRRIEPRAASPESDQQQLQVELSASAESDTLRAEDSSSPTNLICFDASGEQQLHSVVAKRLLNDSKSSVAGPTTFRNLLDTDPYDDFGHLLDQLPSIPTPSISQSQSFLDNDFAQPQPPADSKQQTSADTSASASERLQAIDLAYGSIFAEEPRAGFGAPPNKPSVPVQGPPRADHSSSSASPGAAIAASNVQSSASSSIATAHFSTALASGIGGGGVAISASGVSSSRAAAAPSSSSSSSAAIKASSVAPAKPVARFHSTAADGSSRAIISASVSTSASPSAGNSTLSSRIASTSTPSPSIDSARGAQSTSSNSSSSPSAGTIASRSSNSSGGGSSSSTTSPLTPLSELYTNTPFFCLCHH